VLHEAVIIFIYQAAVHRQKLSK